MCKGHEVGASLAVSQKTGKASMAGAKGIDSRTMR